MLRYNRGLISTYSKGADGSTGGAVGEARGGVPDVFPASSSVAALPSSPGSSLPDSNIK